MRCPNCGVEQEDFERLREAFEEHDSRMHCNTGMGETPESCRAGLKAHRCLWGYDSAWAGQALDWRWQAFKAGWEAGMKTMVEISTKEEKKV